MAGRRDRIQQHREFRITIAIVVGILINCVCAVLFPNQVGLASCESSERVKMLKSDFAIISEKNAELRKQNPFGHLYRDSDVESMSDGHDNGLHASKRVMGMYEFMNSKVLFKTVRKNQELKKLKL